jgi:ELWxxDGT repeat protein
MVVFNNKLFFAAEDAANGFELWSIDTANTQKLEAIIGGGGISSGRPTDLTVLKGLLYFDARSSANGRELWSLSSTGQISLIKDLYTGSSYGTPNSSSPSFLTIHNNILYFRATGSASIGRELYSYDGTTMRLVKNINPSTLKQDSAPESLISTPVGLFFWARTSNSDNTELHVLKNNGNESKIRSFNNVANTQFISSSGFKVSIYMNSALYFPAYDGTSIQIWKTDGTAANTTQVTQLSKIGTGIGDISTIQGSLLFIFGKYNEFVADYVNNLIYFRSTNGIWVLNTADDSYVELMNNSANTLNTTLVQLTD